MQASMISEWIFDLDNTLYPPTSDLFSQIDIKITSYVAELLQLDRVAARQLQKKFYRDHGTTLHGLMIHHDIDPTHYLDAVHDIDYSWLAPNQELATALAKLPGRRIIFTNGDRKHAEKAAEQIGILDLFDDIYDIKAANLVPKPAPETYQEFASRHNVDLSRAVMFEDLARNLLPAKNLGMQTVLVTGSQEEQILKEDWEMVEGDNGHIDHVTDDLAAFLSQFVTGSS